MKSSLQKLQKILKLEADRGYDNRAVLGGLEKILPGWEAEARSEGITENLTQIVTTHLRDYGRLSPTSMAETLNGLWQRIQGEADISLPPLPGLGPEGDLSLKTNEAARETRGVTPKPEHVSGRADSREPSPASQTVQTPTVKTPSQVGTPAALNASITVLPGVGSRHAQTLKRLHLSTLGDMLYYFPRRYDDYTQLKPINRLFFGEEVTVIAMVQSVNLRPIRHGQAQIVEVVVNDGSGALRVTWFNQPWIGKRLQNGTPVVLSGKIDQYLGRLVMNNPEVEPLDQQNLHTNRIVPVYSLTENITQRWLRKQMYQVVTYWAPRIPDHLPDSIRKAANLLDLPAALLQVHFPDSMEKLRAARQRLAFDEIFFLQLGVLRQKHTWQNRKARTFTVPNEWLERQIDCLPFSLTAAQKRVLTDVRSDLASGHPMNRLLQGDVGSGKTVIAALAVAVLARQGVQSALLAPTSILADQHYQNMLNLLSTDLSQVEAAPAVLNPDEIALLIGATPEADKKVIREKLANGDIKLIIGTHALIEDPIIFADLQLVIVDEQHRFGVEQRATLRSKGDNPHLLVMTATPIPRSLALTIYGDLDLSVMDEMPPGRQAVETHVLFPRERERAYSLIRGQLKEGRQAFIVYPLIEENGLEENQEVGRGAVEEYTRLQKEVFPDYRLGLLHGRMKADEKETVMTLFRNREVHVLVSTTVVEVGVDFPNATVMLVEGANRFGLSQLHQLRGRVGRGQDKAYCLLIPETPDLVENERLAAMAETTDGFVLAERDLEQRGPGDFLGTRQSGYRSDLRMASLTDVRLIEKARQQAQGLFAADPDLTLPENQLLSQVLQNYWGSGNEITTKGDIS